MLSLFDDYPIHQTPEPVAHPSTSNKDHYERYWFNGYSTNEDLFFGIGTAYYPHLGIKDAALSVVVDGVQHAFHVSARSTNEPTDLRIGPWQLDLLEPMRSCRLTLASNETGITCDLLWDGRTGNVEEPRHTFGDVRKGMDTTRFTQLGRWSGWIDIDGHRIELDPELILGTKDRSWGLRGVGGGDKRGAPGRGGGLFFLWAPLHFGDICAHYQLFEDPRGVPLFSVGALLPTYTSSADIPGVEDPAVEHMRNNEHRLTFEGTSRYVHTAHLAFTTVDQQTRHEIDLEKIFTFRMKGIGYLHPEWGHGAWKGDLAMAAERWPLDSVDEDAFENCHVQHFVRARMGDRTGIGALEQLFLGPYKPYGFTGLLDRA